MKNFATLFKQFILIALLFPFIATAQTGSVVTQSFQLNNFEELSVRSAIHVSLTQGNENSLTVEGPADLVSLLEYKVSNNKLTLSLKENEKNKKGTGNETVKVTLTFKELTAIRAEGAALVNTVGEINGSSLDLVASGASNATLKFKGQDFSADLSGASLSKLDLNCNTAEVVVSGASNTTLSGTASTFNLKESGASTVKAFSLITDRTDALLSGASSASVLARKSLHAKLSGASRLSFYDNGERKRLNAPADLQYTFSGMDNIGQVIVEDETMQEFNESIKEASRASQEAVREAQEAQQEAMREVQKAQREVQKAQRDVMREAQEAQREAMQAQREAMEENRRAMREIWGDSVARIGSYEIIINDEDVKVKQNKSRKTQRFKGHWDGIELGVNGYLNSDGKMDLPEGYEAMELDYAKSIVFNLNLFELSQKIVTNHFGVVSGLGLSWHNYRFDQKTRLTEDNGILTAYFDNNPAINYDKSKLMVLNLTLPVLLEYQTNPNNDNSFHMAAGVIGNLKLGSHAKYKFSENGTQKQKARDDFYLNPFSCDATVRVGWNFLNLFANYALTPMFQNNKGPKLYPFSVGISLDWNLW